MTVFQQLNRQRASEIAGLTADANVLYMGIGWIKAGTPVAEVRDHLARLAGIREAVAQACAQSRTIDPALADEMFTEGLSASEARERLATMVSAAPAALRRTAAGDGGAEDRHGWGAAFAKASAGMAKTDLSARGSQAPALATSAPAAKAPEELESDGAWDAAFSKAAEGS